MATVRTAVIPAAGRGTRMWPATAVIPKVLLPILNRPVIEMVIDEALEAGIERVIIVIGTGCELVRAHFAALGAPYAGHIEYVLQPQQRGLGDALYVARDAVGDEPFVLLFGDTAFLGESPTQKLCADFEKHGEALIGVQPIPVSLSSKRGMIDAEPVGEGRHRVRRVVEKPSPEESPSNLAVAARDLFLPSIFEGLAGAQPDHTGEVQLAAGINRITSSEPVAAIELLGQRLDIGNPRDCYDAIMAVGREQFGESKRGDQ